MFFSQNIIEEENHEKGIIFIYLYIVYGWLWYGKYAN